MYVQEHSQKHPITGSTSCYNVHIGCAVLEHITSIVCTLKASVGVKYNNTKEVYYVNIGKISLVWIFCGALLSLYYNIYMYYCYEYLDSLQPSYMYLYDDFKGITSSV